MHQENFGFAIAIFPEWCSGVSISAVDGTVFHGRRDVSLFYSDISLSNRTFLEMVHSVQSMYLDDVVMGKL